MATIDEIFATMTVDENTLATDEVLVIDPNTRQINIPGSELVFGVESDTGAERKYFMAPRYVGNNLDLASCFIRVNYRNANGEIDAHLVQDVVATEDNIRFSWELARKVTLYKGQVQFVVCAVRPDSNGKLLNEWNTTLANGMVLAGLEPDSAVIEAETKDVVAQLIALVEAQSANVEAVGATQVAKVKSAAQDAEADAVAQVEAKGASTLATIPGEYTATVRAVQGAANAIRKKVSGEVIRVDDVSPMEHYPEITVKSKNRFNAVEWMNAQYEMNGITITRNADKITINGTASTSFSCPVLRLIEPITVGKTYTCTVFRISGTGNDVVAAIGEGTSQGVRDKFYDCVSRENAESNSLSFTASYPYWTSLQLYFNSGVSFSDLVIAIQFEESEVATEYTPYIDPTTVTMKRYAKNLLGGYATHTVNGVTFTVHENGAISVEGTATADAGINTKIRVGPGTYTVSGDLPGSILLDGDMYVWASVTQGIIARSHTGSGNRTFTLPDESYLDVYIRVKSGRVCKGEMFYPQIEAGTKATVFATHDTPVSHTPDSNGSVSGLSAVSPTMTLLTDTAGVNIECEYSRDTNKVVNEILEAIAALTSGT